MKYYSIVLALGLLSLSACTSVNVRPVPAGQPIKAVCIRENPKVIVADFVDILVAGFARHGINATVIPPTAKPSEEFVVDYVAYRKWDMAPYLVDATIRITRNGQIFASAEYHLKGGGGLSLAKWNSTKSKIDPVLDQLLVNYE
ncbi:MAG TPA: Sbal_3080 family lipoprotein [Clostridia bacterium]|nr:Sbal_3080 family lipoprotein [Clostridia bacterium]